MDPADSPRDGSASRSAQAAPRRSDVRGVLWGAALGGGLFVAWQTAGTLLLIFAGLLFGALLEACTRGLAVVLPVGRAWRLAVVCLALSLSTAWLLVWGGTSLVGQADGLIQLIGEQLRLLRGELRSMGFAAPTSSDGPRTLAQLLFPNPGALFGTAYSAFNLASGLLGNVVVVLFIGLFVAVSPGTYRRSLVRLVPHERRARVGAVLDEMAAALRRWLVGQLAAVVVIALTTWFGLWLIGMPGALLLGLQAGVVNFIPYLGPVVGAAPILLAAMAQGTEMVVWALAVHLLIQTVEGYILTPMIQAHAVDVSPVATLAAVMVFGALFGALGIALATPIIAVINIAIARLYVEDYLDAARPGPR